MPKRTTKYLLLVFLSLITFSSFAAPDGAALFKANCASCHNPIKESTGPALQGASSRVPSKEWLYKWVKNSAAVIASGDKYANDIYAKYNKTAMTAFPTLSTEEIDAILKYADDYKAPVANAATAGAGQPKKSENNSLLYFILTAVLAIAAIVLYNVNKSLKTIAAVKEGVPVRADIPWYKNKLYLAILGVVAFVGCGAVMSGGLITLGREKNYMPKQPIFYSHKVHAGINQVNCQYCHSAAEKSKHSMIPSTNVCMNCHKGISEYTGEAEHPLVTNEGKKVNGTLEIQKLYEYAGWDKATKSYKRDANGNILAKPIPWVKIHNLPDHVFFNHANHVKVGKVECQRCHGDVQNMDEVYQYTDLSMGMCVNCHRETKVQFTENNYYSIFKKYHDEIKSGKREDVKVEDIGGLECQRCHY